MLTGLFSSQTALNAFQTSLNNTSNNLANVNTTAFKSGVVGFQDLVSNGQLNKQLGSGVKVAAVSPRDFKQGPINKTGRDLDVAISGTGFMIVQVSDGTFMYTRDGALNRDASGRLVTNAGNVIQPPITIPNDTISTSIANDGTVTVITSSAPGTHKVVGQIQMAQFQNQEGLRVEPGNLYSETAASGSAVIGTPGTGGLGQIQQNALEQSNVDVSTELTTMVVTQQAFAANSKAINSANQLLVSALSLIS